MKRTVIAVFLCSMMFSSYSQPAKDKPLFSIGVDSATGPALLKQCSRATPKHISSYWTLSQSDIDALEAHLPKLDLLTATACCVIGAKIKNRKDCGFQYIGVVINKKKFIYINAFPAGDPAMYKKEDPAFDPAKAAIVVCDGGESFWGALFDVETKTFSMLSFNGYA